MHRSRKALFLTKYSCNGASSRYRTLQYIPWFQASGLEFEVSPLFDEAYLIDRYESGSGRLTNIVSAFVRRLRTLLTVRRFDLVVVEKEILPYFSALPERWLGWLGVPYIVDYDDALFHQYDMHDSWLVRLVLGRKIARVMRGSEIVIAGNEYLAAYASRVGAKRVELIPTVIDLERYPLPPAVTKINTDFTIGWIGSPSTATYLKAIAPALANVCHDGRARVQLIGAGPIELSGVPVQALTWNEANESKLLRQFDVGVMPLSDRPWEHGKCGLKLVQYMASGLPVVASPVGANCEIVEHGINGFLAVTQQDWEKALRLLQEDPCLRQRMGQAGRKKVKERYSLHVTGPRLAEIIQYAAAKRLSNV